MTQLIQGSFTGELKSRYLTYAMSTIMARALPDARDGLKPVHRRLMYVMRLLRLDPDKAYKKCARVVGDVIGKYHPHGDQSVYDAMVRLAQDFAVRYPLVDGQGNFGSIDGDSAAAMRYTEAKLTKVAQYLMLDIESGTVDFRENYDESEQEPIVMPACFPNLLANGSAGIAVGMSTNIPPHNVGEICDALLAKLKKPETDSLGLMKYLKGPDFPTGGIIAETPEALAQCYTTGRGQIRVRAKWEKEELPRGLYQIVITEIPYQVQKSKLIERIADLINMKKLPWLADVHDESAEDIRIVLEPKSRSVDATALMEALFRQCDLEVRFSFIMNAINSKSQPELMTLARVLEEFIDHRRDVMLRKSSWRLNKINERLHLLEAYKVVYLNIDEVIEIIKTQDEPAPVMMERFGIDRIQADAILNMRLRSLRKLEEMEIRREHDELSAEKDKLTALLADPALQDAALTEEVKHIKKEFADKRRTEIGSAPSAVVIPLEAHIEREPTTVLMSRQGWLKAVKGHIGDQEVRYKEGDEELFRVPTQTTSQLCALTKSGRVFTLPVSKMPPGRGFGEPVQLMVDLPNDDTIISLFDANSAEKYLLATRKGYGFITTRDALLSQMRTGKQVVNVTKGDATAFCLPVIGDSVAAYGGTRRLLVFPLNEVAEMTRGKGVKLINLKNEDLIDIIIFTAANGLGMRGGPNFDRERIFTDLSLWDGKRAQVGRTPPHGFQQNLKFFALSQPAPVEEGTPDPDDVPVTDDVRLSELIRGMGKGEELDLFGDMLGGDKADDDTTGND